MGTFYFIDNHNTPVFKIDTILNIILQNIIASTDAEHIPEVLFNLILHEISHALGFSQSQFQK